MAGCNENWFESLSAWHDGEVTRDEARRVEGHLSECAECRATVERFGSLSAALGSVTLHDAPAFAREVFPRANRGSFGGRRPWWVVPAAAAFAGVATFFVASQRRELPVSAADEIVTRHVAGFRGVRPYAIESSDPQVVSAWVSERAGFPVELKLPDDTELVGARICHLCGEATPAIMLKHAGTPTTVFVPSAGSEGAREAERLARGSLGCMRGPLDHAICACGSPQPMLAVAQGQPAEVSAVLAAALP